ncbi:MAG: imidazoleglycerol-phosphate dehydratase HisB [Candidatus Bathyarchaeota archaeon]
MRQGTIERKTKETSITVKMNLDGKGHHEIVTRLNFLDHLVNSFALHGLIDLRVSADGDLHVDDHHLVEDVAITLGQALMKALGEKRGIRRFGTSITPMDDVLIIAAIDLSDRAHFESNLEFKRTKLGDMAAEMVNHFFKSFAEAGKFNLHLLLLKGKNDHHKAEAAFKAVAIALSQAIEINPRIKGHIPSAKGTF